MTTTNKFLQKIKSHRENKKDEKFTGTLETYLGLLEKTPEIAALAHKRLYRQILDQGMVTLDAINFLTESQ